MRVSQRFLDLEIDHGGSMPGHILLECEDVYVIPTRGDVSKGV